MFDHLINAANASPVPAGSYSTLDQIFVTIMNLGAGLALFFGMFGILYAAMTLALGGGSTGPESLQKFKDSLWYSVIAIIIAVGITSIKLIVVNTIGSTAII